jgi:hypothetical protein
MAKNYDLCHPSVNRHKNVKRAKQIYTLSGSSKRQKDELNTNSIFLNKNKFLEYKILCAYKVQKFICRA